MRYRFDVSGADLDLAGKAATDMKKILLRLGIAPDIIRRVTVAMYEGEINMAIHAGGGVAEVDIDPARIRVELSDRGPGIPDLGLAMQEGWSTAPEHIRERGFGAGMGLPNMRNNADDFSIETTIGEGTRVTMAVNLIRDHG